MILKIFEYSIFIDSNKNAGKSSRLPQNMNPKFNINKVSLSPQKMNKGVLSQSNVG